MELIKRKLRLNNKNESEPHYINWNLTAECFLTQTYCYRVDNLACALLSMQNSWDYHKRQLDLNSWLIREVGVVGKNKRFPEKGFYWYPCLEIHDIDVDNKDVWKMSARLIDIRKGLLERKTYKADLYKIFDRDLFERTMFKWSEKDVDDSAPYLEKIPLSITDTAKLPAKTYKNWTSDLDILTYQRWYKLDEFWEAFSQIWNQERIETQPLLDALKKCEYIELVSETKRFPAEGIYVSEFLSGKKITKFIKKLKVWLIKKGDRKVMKPRFIYSMPDLFINNIKKPKMKLFDRNTFEAEFGLLAVE